MKRILPFLLVWISSSLTGQTSLDPFFSNRMVIQRDAPIPVWGHSNPSSRITIKMAGQVLHTAADKAGQWNASLPTLAAGGPYQLEVRAADTTILLRDILIGDLWVCAGQSNMRWRVQDATGADLESIQPPISGLRLLDLEGSLEPINKRYPLSFLQALTPQNYYLPAQWQVAAGKPAQLFSAVGYFFGKLIHEKTGVPVGMIQTAVGGVPLESYLPLEIIQRDTILYPLAQPGWDSHPLYPRWTAERIHQNLVAWEELSPRPEPMPAHPFAPGFLFDAAIRPILPIPVKGILWYQGESNATYTADTGPMPAALNTHKLRLLIQSFREMWHRPDLPFLMVQLPAIQRDWELFRDIQRQIAAESPATGLAITLDLGHATDVHPRDKQPVAERLARLALHRVYHLPVLSEGPRLQRYEVKDNRILLYFEPSESPLSTRNGLPLEGFYIAGENQLFVEARTEWLNQNTIACWHPTISQPAAVRYAWEDFPSRANLMNKAGLPAAPFRTDTWPLAK